nr:MAG TPA: hypothetical protein [Caudoviricetes sp.]
MIWRADSDASHDRNRSVPAIARAYPHVQSRRAHALTSIFSKPRPPPRGGLSICPVRGRKGERHGQDRHDT